DDRALAGDSVQAVFAEDLIKRVIDVEPADVSVTGPAEVIRLQIMIDHGAEQVRSSKKTIFVVMPAVIVEVADKRQLAGITFPNQVLAENIRDVDLLFAWIEFVEIGISILLPHIERGQIVLPAIVVVVPENPDAEIRVVENESAEVAHERLHPDAHGNKIVIVR